MTVTDRQELVDILNAISNYSFEAGIKSAQLILSTNNPEYSQADLDGTQIFVNKLILTAMNMFDVLTDDEKYIMKQALKGKVHTAEFLKHKWGQNII